MRRFFVQPTELGLAGGQVNPSTFEQVGKIEGMLDNGQQRPSVSEDISRPAQVEICDGIQKGKEGEEWISTGSYIKKSKSI